MTNNLNNLKAIPEKKRMGTFKRFKSIFTKTKTTKQEDLSSLDDQQFKFEDKDANSPETEIRRL